MEEPGNTGAPFWPTPLTGGIKAIKMSPAARADAPNLSQT